MLMAHQNCDCLQFPKYGFWCTYEVRGIVPFGVSGVLKNNVPQKALITGNSKVRS